MNQRQTSFISESHNYKSTHGITVFNLNSSAICCGLIWMLYVLDIVEHSFTLLFALKWNSPCREKRLTWRDPRASQMGSELWVGMFSERDWIGPTACGQEPQRCKKWGVVYVVVKSRGHCALSSAVQLKLWKNTLFLHNSLQLPQNKPLCH